jgi:hypothetical protein
MTSTRTNGTNDQCSERTADFDTIDCDDVFLESNLDSKKSFESSLNFEEMSNCLINLIDNQNDCKNVKSFDNIIDYNNQCDFSFF